MDDLFWLSIYGTIWDILWAFIYSIVGLAESKPFEWVRDLIISGIGWIRQASAADWLSIITVVLFWPVILIVYLVQSVLKLFKTSDPIVSMLTETLMSLISSNLDASDLEAFY